MVEVSLYGDRLFIIFIKTSDGFLVKKLKERFRDIFYISVNACVVLNFFKCETRYITTAKIYFCSEISRYCSEFGWNLTKADKTYYIMRGFVQIVKC